MNTKFHFNSKGKYLLKCVNTRVQCFKAKLKYFLQHNIVEGKHKLNPRDFIRRTNTHYLSACIDFLQTNFTLSVVAIKQSMPQ